MHRDSFVAVVKGKEPYECVCRCLQLLAEQGLHFNKPGKVLIKPNLALPEPHQYLPGCTDPLVIGALVEEFRARGASQVLVGEEPIWGVDAEETFSITGTSEVVKNKGGEVTYFDREERVTLTVKDPHVFRTISVPRSVAECDLLVNVPKLKTNFMTGMTLGVKNLLGCIQYEQRKRFHREIDLYYALVDIVKTLRPGLTVIDGIVAMEGWGPHAGNPVDLGVIVGGSDIVAVDAITSYIVGLDPHSVGTTQVAERDGLGTASLSDIVVLGEEVENVRKVLERPQFKFVGKAPNVHLFPGGVCPGCRARIPLIPLEVDSDKKYGIIIGREPIALPEILDVDEVWLVGNCALRAGMAYVLREMVSRRQEGCLWKPSIEFVPGCPPLDYYSEHSTFKPLRQKGWMKRDPVAEGGRYR